MTLLKNLITLSLMVMCSACSVQNNLATKRSSHIQTAKAVSVLKENELDLSRFVEGEIVIEELKPIEKSKAKFDPDFTEEGYASWYGPGFHGRKTANGSIYNQHEYTAAHRTLPMPSVVRVVNQENKRSVLVVINDRGPYVHKSRNRVIDLSHKAARDLGILSKGVAKVKIEYLHDETIALLSKFPKDKKMAASSKLSQSLIRQVTHLNLKNGTNL